MKVRERKAKGALSVLDEFTAGGIGEIIAVPNLSQDKIQRINDRTKLADLPQTQETLIPDLVFSIDASHDFSSDIDSVRLCLKNEESLKDSIPEPPHKNETPQMLISGTALDDKTGDKLETKPETNQGQTEDKLETDTELISSVSGKTRDKLETQPETQIGTNWRQTRDKLETNLSFSSLVGLQRTLLLFIYDSCVQNQSGCSQPITIDHFISIAQTTVTSIKKTIQRLVEKGFIFRDSFKNGRGGWTIYRIEKSVFQELLQHETRDKLRTNWRQTRDKVGTQLETQLETSLSSQSVSNFNNTNYLAAGFLSSVNFSAVEPFGITKSLLSDFQKNGWSISQEQLEAHIDRFSQWASIDPKAKTVKNFRALFCSHVATIAKTGIDPLDYIKTEVDRTTEAILVERKAILEERRRQQQEMMQVEFEIWQMDSPRAELIKLVPESSFAKFGSELYKGLLKNYFIENIWSSKNTAV